MNMKQLIQRTYSRLVTKEEEGRSVGRCFTRDAAFTFRMGAGFLGDVNRAHPFSVEPALPDPTNPPTAYGQPVLVVSASQGVRAPLTSDYGVATNMYGITVRPFPIQQALTGGNQYGGVAFGSGIPPTNQPIDVLKAGYILVQQYGTVVPVKGSNVYVWLAASAGAHVLGGFEAAATGGSTLLLPNAYWNGSPDANGVAEIYFTGIGA